jgi:hypothetical protein
LRKAKKEEILRRWVLPHLPDFSIKNGILYQVPMNHVLRGFILETRAGSADSAYVIAFCQPLYVPREDIMLSFGERLPRGSALLARNEIWSFDKANISDTTSALAKEVCGRGLKMLKRYGTPEKIAGSFFLHASPFQKEAIAYSHALLDHTAEATTRLQHLLEKRETQLHAETSANALTLLRAMKEGHQKVKLLLSEWENRTLSNLGLT